MTVDPASSMHQFNHAGHTYHFCSSGCRTKFQADPAGYISDQRFGGFGEGICVAAGDGDAGCLIDHFRNSWPFLRLAFKYWQGNSNII